MPYEDFKYVFVKQQIPKLTVKDTQCPFCSQNIDLENNCVICENGHRLHQNCWQNQSDKLKCPVCHGIVEQNCYGFNRKLGKEGQFAYSYLPKDLPKRGGRYKKHKTLKRKRSSKKHRKNTNKSKKNKRTRYHRKSKK